VSATGPDAEFLERVRAIHEGRLTPPPTRDAATVLLVRDAATERPDGTGRLEVFLLRRVATMVFGAGMHVFPGGKVDPDDDLDASVTLPAEWAELLTGGDAALLRRVVAAAVRETREEAGVVVDPLELRPFAHWITPAPEIRRYDTRFLICALPPGERASLADGEADRGLWIAPQAALLLPLMPPTRISLQDLAECRDTAEALARERVIRPVAPDFVPDGDGFRFTVDGT
jgi:8-oxo-dGTP pyrophosphatase MutT (NUDIX family)